MKALNIIFGLTIIFFTVPFAVHAQQTPTGQVEVTKPIEVGNKICPVSGNKVDDGKMGEAVKYTYNGKIYNLCCPMCIKDFKKDPAKYSKIAEDEVKKEKELMSDKAKTENDHEKGQVDHQEHGHGGHSH